MEKSPSFRRGSICAQVPKTGVAFDTQHAIGWEYVIGHIIPIARPVSPKRNAHGEPWTALGRKLAINSSAKAGPDDRMTAPGGSKHTSAEHGGRL